ncbi:LINE-1 retrotransposable element ORF2 protein [Eumeta japonica]|uniref:LINE-1 retrotransposable element ORF2 protein n=1 Tax=Eumeta variegata TaxID=151549 RepID=A0A4C1X9B7_EUMVA|nr:LINE-1 retrotransposable element ORF2 protein [Eumeta japonica]
MRWFFDRVVPPYPRNFTQWQIKKWKREELTFLCDVFTLGGHRSFEHDCDILETATSYYKKLYGNDKTEEEIDLANTISIPSILEADVEKAIDTQSIDKTPGLDGINNEILVPVLTDIFNDIIDTEIMPQQWPESNIILLYIKRENPEIGNYRPISLTSIIYKVFAKIILKRIERTLDEQQPIEQAGFQRNTR